MKKEEKKSLEKELLNTIYRVLAVQNPIAVDAVAKSIKAATKSIVKKFSKAAKASSAKISKKKKTPAAKKAPLKNIKKKSKQK